MIDRKDQCTRLSSQEQKMLSRARLGRVGPPCKPVVGEDGMPVFPNGRPIELRRNVRDDGVQRDLVGGGRYHVSDG